MTSRFTLGAYWGDRRESRAECARRTSECLSRLARCDEAFAQWCQKGGSRRQAVEREVQPTEEVLASLLRESRRDVDRSVIEELGYTLGLWNGADEDESASISFSCGGCAGAPDVLNSVVLRLPRGGAAAARLLRVDALVETMDAVVSSWEPDRARVISQEHLELLARRRGRPTVGWLLYLSRRRGEIPRLPAPARVVPLAAGSVIVLTDDCFSVERPDHLQHARRVEAILDEHGLLEPAPQSESMAT